jgi:hypothetical protein
MASRILRTDSDRTGWATFLAAQPLPVTVTMIKGARRSLPQNATASKWYAEIAAETGDTPIAVKALCKHQFGLMIMQAENPAWVAEWEPLYAPLDYPRRLKLFEVIPLTSKFTTRQMAAYMDAVQKTYTAQGIRLTDPELQKYQKEMTA